MLQEVDSERGMLNLLGIISEFDMENKSRGDVRGQKYDVRKRCKTSFWTVFQVLMMPLH